jgi:hypothetical protein
MPQTWRNVAAKSISLPPPVTYRSNFKMPSFNSSAYANHPIQIPPEFPKILKQYTKAAIRTQPKDLLLWSVSYFR